MKRARCRRLGLDVSRAESTPGLRLSIAFGVPVWGWL